MKTITACGLAAVLLSLSAAPTLAAPAAQHARRPPGAENSFKPPVTAGGIVHSVVGVLQDEQDISVGPVLGHNVLGKPIKLKCANANGCTILVSAAVWATTDVAGNDWAICPIIDGSYFAGACYYFGSMNNSGEGAYGVSKGSFPVAKGTHTVASDVYFDQDATAFHFSTTYTILNP